MNKFRIYDKIAWTYAEIIRTQWLKTSVGAACTASQKNWVTDDRSVTKSIITQPGLLLAFKTRYKIDSKTSVLRLSSTDVTCNPFTLVPATEPEGSTQLIPNKSSSPKKTKQQVPFEILYFNYPPDQRMLTQPGLKLKKIIFMIFSSFPLSLASGRMTRECRVKTIYTLLTFPILMPYTSRCLDYTQKFKRWPEFRKLTNNAWRP
jgi:hypothetical protein